LQLPAGALYQPGKSYRPRSGCYGLGLKLSMFPHSLASAAVPARMIGSKRY